MKFDGTGKTTLGERISGAFVGALSLPTLSCRHRVVYGIDSAESTEVRRFGRSCFGVLETGLG